MTSSLLRATVSEPHGFEPFEVQAVGVGDRRSATANASVPNPSSPALVFSPDEVLPIQQQPLRGVQLRISPGLEEMR